MTATAASGSVFTGWTGSECLAAGTAPCTITVDADKGFTAIFADATLPVAPASLSVGTITTTSVALSWPAGSDNVGVTGYRIYQTGVVPPVATTGGGLSVTVSSLAPSTSYTFRVEAIDAAGNESTGGPTAPATTLTPPDTTLPVAPASLSVGTITTTSVALSWPAGSDNVGVTGYRIYQTGVVPPVATTGGGLSVTVSSLAPSTSYTFRVEAIDAAGNESTGGPTAPATTLTPPDATLPVALRCAPASLSVGTDVTTRRRGGRGRRFFRGVDAGRRFSTMVTGCRRV